MLAPDLIISWYAVQIVSKLVEFVLVRRITQLVSIHNPVQRNFAVSFLLTEIWGSHGSFRKADIIRAHLLM